MTEGKIWLALIYLESLQLWRAPVCLCVRKVLCCLLTDVAMVAKEIVNFGLELPLIQTTSVAPREFALSDCFPAQICIFAGYFASFFCLIRKMLLLCVMGRLPKVFVGRFLYGCSFEDSEKASFILGAVELPLSPCVVDSLLENSVS